MKVHDIAKNIDDYIDDYGRKVSKYDIKSMKRVQGLLNTLTLDNDGNIKTNIKNLRIIRQVKKELGKTLRESGYQKQVAKIKGFINDISEQQTAFFAAAFTEFSKPKVIKHLKETAWNETVNGLTEVGVNENIVNETVDIVSKGIRGGESFGVLNEKVKTFLQGDKETDGAFERYSKVYLSDTLHGFSRNYNNLISADLNLEWFRYMGGLIKTSRPWCVAMEGKEYVHKSELATCARGNIDGEDVSRQGLKAGTTGDNLVDRCGGWNCRHHLVPIPTSIVPTKIRRKFEPDIKPDDDEQAAARPRR